MTPIKIGITGGIGSGKSVVASVLQTMGIPVFDCDAESKRLCAVHPGIRQQLIELVGPEVYQGNDLNKPLLASYLFSSSSHVLQVNGIIHPVLKDYFKRWVSEQHTEMVAIESAILFEAGYDDVVDSVIMVSAPLEVRIARAMQRDGATREAIEERIRQQMDDEEKRSRSQFVVVNDGNSPVIPQVLEIINTLSQK
jgi:dephospho-CoA kinase